MDIDEEVVDSLEEESEPVHHPDEFDQLKKGYSIGREYEIYLETEKKY